MYGFVEFVIMVRWRSAWHGYQWCVRNRINCMCSHSSRCFLGVSSGAASV